ncbi:hypothetical protein Q3G72_034109 [Acer saccharum]|nr:hypothetical protein Q3G72_034109 [Acer saccharum]
MTDAAAGSESYINNNNNNIEETVASSSNTQEKNLELLDSVYSAAADGDIDKFQQHAGVIVAVVVAELTVVEVVAELTVEEFSSG